MSDDESKARKWMRTHNTRDARKRKQAARNKAREVDARERKHDASRPPYNPNGPN